ncbi:CDP-glucose 4,6-dehydratase [Pseudogemmobacter sp. W21_MBD1_M6]|uniref:CDP-glucose 4,6-dehydratase n=1 Tax=Pseudogemmobacter sp. W21_MBD1_M6 TaxID=3240271 RepID=UPI003F985059
MGKRQSTLAGLVVNKMSWAGRNVFITGHTGFKGSWLSLLLGELGAHVWGYALAPATEPALFHQAKIGETIRNHQIGDIRDIEKLQSAIVTSRADVIFHLAAQALVRPSYDNPLETWSSNLMGTVNLMEAARRAQQQSGRPMSVVAITTDKVYHNHEWVHSYRENDRLGGKDPYSASKAACELAIHSFAESFASPDRVRIASARAGNVIGGGDWAEDRIVPDMVRALSRNCPVAVRNPHASRPWQHVLDPLNGYLCLAEALLSATPDQLQHLNTFNFGPESSDHRSVGNLVTQGLRHWPGSWTDISAAQGSAPHEANLLALSIDKARHVLGWSPVWSFEKAVEATMEWYKRADEGADIPTITQAQVTRFAQDAL